MSRITCPCCQGTKVRRSRYFFRALVRRLLNVQTFYCTHCHARWGRRLSWVQFFRTSIYRPALPLLILGCSLYLGAQAYSFIQYTWDFGPTPPNQRALTHDDAQYELKALSASASSTPKRP